MAKFKRGANSEWIDAVLRKGTIADRLAAHTLLIHESKDWKSLDALIDMVDPRKCRRRCVMAMNTLRELFIESLNIGRNSCRITDEEDKKRVRFYYTRFIDQLNLVAFDQLQETRSKAIWILSELLSKHLENKDYILEKLVNKLGDKVPKLASTAGHFIEKAANSEKEAIRLRTVKYVQRFLTQPNQSSSARYYAVALLSRIKLIKGHHEMANELVQTYLNLYTSLMREKQLDSKLMSTLLVGIHRTYPYSKLNNDVFEQHLQTLYTLVHQVNFRMRVVAMVLIKNIVTKRAQLLKCPVEDRFYNLIFGQLIEPDFHRTSRQEAFISLVQDVINGDTVVERKEAFVKRMLQVALNSQPDVAHILLKTISKIKESNADLCLFDEKVESDSKKDIDEEFANIPDNGSSWVHNQMGKDSKSCDLLARNPRAARPEQLNELYLLKQSFDSSIAELATTLIK